MLIVEDVGAKKGTTKQTSQTHRQNTSAFIEETQLFKREPSKLKTCNQK